MKGSDVKVAPVIAIVICFAFVSLGDIVSLKTKAKFPSLAVAIVAYLIAIWCGMPKTYPDVSGLAALGDILFPVFVAGLATSILPISIVKNWKFVIIGCIAVLADFLCTVVVGGLFYDPREMFAAAMTTCGSGLTGGLIVLDRLKGTGLTEMVTIPLLLACTIDAIGQPVGSLITRKYAGKLIASDAYLTDKIVDHSDGGKLNKWGAPFNSSENPSPRFCAWIPPKYETEAVAFLQLIVVTALAMWLGGITGLGWSIVLILLGFGGTFIGLFRMNMLDRTQTGGFVMAAIYALLFQMLNDMTLQEIMAKIVPLLLVILLSGVGLVLGGMLGSKVFGFDPWLGASATIGLFYLFPGVRNVINEVARSLSRNEEERLYLVEKISPSCIIAASMGSKFCLLAGVLLMPLIIR